MGSIRPRAGSRPLLVAALVVIATMACGPEGNDDTGAATSGMDDDGSGSGASASMSDTGSASGSASASGTGTSSSGTSATADGGSSEDTGAMPGGAIGTECTNDADCASGVCWNFSDYDSCCSGTACSTTCRSDAECQAAAADALAPTPASASCGSDGRCSLVGTGLGQWACAGPPCG